MPVRKNIQLTAAVIVQLSLAASLVAQQQSARSSSHNAIAIGQSVAGVKDLLRTHGIETCTDNLAFAKTDDDLAYFTFDLDEKCSFAVIFYSATTKTVTGMKLVFFPTGNASKSTQSWVPARSISLGDDHSYTVQFLPPANAPTKKPVPSRE